MHKIFINLIIGHLIKNNVATKDYSEVIDLIKESLEYDYDIPPIEDPVVKGLIRFFTSPHH